MRISNNEHLALLDQSRPRLPCFYNYRLILHDEFSTSCSQTLSIKFGIVISPTVSPLMIKMEHIVIPYKVLSSSFYVKVTNMKLMEDLTRAMRASDNETHCRQFAADHQN